MRMLHPPAPCIFSRAFVSWAFLILLTTAAQAAEPSWLILGAHEFDRGNLQVSQPNNGYAETFACVWNGGTFPNSAEYDIDFPTTGEYTLVGFYTAAASRPVDILLDGKKIHTGFSSVTGDWGTDAAKWEKQCKMRVTKGRHIITLRRQSAMPHICALALRSPEGDWNRDQRKPSKIDWRSLTSELTIPAEEYDTGNIRVSQIGGQYAGLHACIWSDQKYPNQADYLIEFPADGAYRISALYTAADSRPVEILLDGKAIHTGLADVTGSWNTDHAKWEPQCSTTVTKGKHTITLRSEQSFPHICAIRITSSEQLAAGRYFDRPSLQQRKLRMARLAKLKAGIAAVKLIDIPAMRLAVDDLATRFPKRFIPRTEAMAKVSEIEVRREAVRKAFESNDATALDQLNELLSLRQDLLLANPLIDFDDLLIVKRDARTPGLALPYNWWGNSSLPRGGYNDEIATLSIKKPAAETRRLFKPQTPVFVGDVDLHFDANRLLFSSLDKKSRWQVYEVGIDGTGLRQVTQGLYDDVDNYDACYLPDDRIIFGSTRSFASVPCVNGSSRVANLFLAGSDGKNVRQLCFDQEHNWCPTVGNDGRVIYTRWEYTDTPHTHSRILFRMNPDGTGQSAIYGSGSYWPNAMFYTRPIPGDPNKVVTIISGHHGVRRMGELVILDPAQGSHEAAGVVQRIPGHGKKVEALIEDQLVDNSWPKFLHPYPLDDKYFLVACQPSASSLWGIYLVDVFDNIVLIKEQADFALLEPLPIRKVKRPPARQDLVDLERKDAVVLMSDIYSGPGLAGIPRGTVKNLRLFTYTYDYPGMGGPQGVVGMEGPWDVRRILGTVRVESDGSASFRIPANTPISVQPLNEKGEALQLMRSWFTGMPGETVSCVGCHKHQGGATPNRKTLAAVDKPQDITSWRGPSRGFSFQREVQPVINKYCVGCHNGERQLASFHTDTKPPLSEKSGQTKLLDLRGTTFITDYDSRYHFGGADAGKFSIAYANLQRFVRRSGLESDFHLLTPMDFHVSTTQLYQMLKKGHHGVKLDEEAWDRLVTWMDLNAPYHGSWVDIAGKARVEPLAKRRREMLKRYGQVNVDMEWTGPALDTKILPISFTPRKRPTTKPPQIAGWPFDAREAQRRVAKEPASEREFELGGVKMKMVRVPGGDFLMGSETGFGDESPQTDVHVDSFWMGQIEITNAQYAQFDAQHDSRVEVRHGMQFGVRGWPLNGPEQPVVRVSWRQAIAFCQWLSKKTGKKFRLPTEAEWEYACRAGTATPYSFGTFHSDFSKHANLADMKLRDAVSHPYKKENVLLPNPSKYDDWIPRSNRFNDGQLVSAGGGKFLPNAFGLQDMHGNVWEWTVSAARPYPYDKDDGRNNIGLRETRIARGGSWRDRPQRATSSIRLAYAPYQRVYNVGFRVVCDGVR